MKSTCETKYFKEMMMSLPNMISGSVRNTFPHQPGIRHVEAVVDQFVNIGKFGARECVDRQP